ncbi:hypothetical protein IE077_001672 [Cardiosporidium cionae]|uniref:C2CD5 C-terminal domain-containing protein n=1 Tax=Cardiosporidium cionae TaxID=476202 RepID=A0ABQ7JCG2_9APIC|nr:hypothetical protein IE077_001672 [Cardiosporidium cionae]|eukprot:KAF8821723.1 hypothetical protein IE077_001672 [Cardiosporidium cionae]
MVIGQGFLKEEIRTGEKTREIDFQNYKGAENPFVLISPLISLPFCVIERNFGLISLHVIKETIYFKSVETFYQELMAHSLAIVRAHVLALGGNAFLGYSIRNIYTKEDKNQHYAVLSIAGDVARVVYSQE